MDDLDAEEDLESIDDEDLEEGEFITSEADRKRLLETPYDFDRVFNEDEVIQVEPIAEVEHLNLNPIRDSPDEPKNAASLRFAVYANIVDEGHDNIFDLYWNIDATREVDLGRFNIPPVQQDHEFIVNRLIPGYRGHTGLMISDAYKPSMFWEYVSDKDAPKYFSVIQSWFYDHRIKLFIIKRKEGC